MSIDKIPPDLRIKDVFHHIDMGFLNRRLGITALPGPIRDDYIARAKPGNDHTTVLGNDHLLVMMLLDVYQQLGVPTLLNALERDVPRLVFKSTEHLAPCPDVYKKNKRIEHEVVLPFDLGKKVVVSYHTSHLVSDTGRMTLERGGADGHRQAMLGILHNEPDRFRIEPIVMGAPWLEHPRNGPDAAALMWMAKDFGEILPEDIDQFSKMKEVKIASAEEWMQVMRRVREEHVKLAVANLLGEPSKKDWGGETNDHFSASITLSGARKTAAFMFKGPTNFREMTLDLCGKRADQIFRLTNSGADLSIVQHSHLIGEAVRGTLRSLTFYPGRPRKYCLIDGPATYRILKAYNKLPTDT